MPEKCGVDDYGNLYLVGRKGECVYPPKDCWSKLDLLYHIAALEAERDEVRAEVARMRPVVEAAVEIHNGPEYCDEALLDKYYNALDNYMESTK